MDRELRIKRLLYKSWHRGCKETDLILGGFSQKYLKGFTDEELDLYESFINEDDWDIYAWLTQNKTFPQEHVNKVTDLLRSYDATEQY